MRALNDMAIAMILILLGLAITNANACSTTSVIEMEKCKVKHKFYAILKKIRPDQEYTLEPIKEGDNKKSLYQRLLMKNKPTIKEMEKELQRWKDRMRPELQFKDDLKSLKYSAMGSVRCRFFRANNKLLKKNILKNKDIKKLECLKEKEIEIQAEIDEIKSKKLQTKMKRQLIKDYDCQAITESYLKHVCEYYKMRL
jgi:hypothetical protein